MPFGTHGYYNGEFLVLSKLFFERQVENKARTLRMKEIEETEEYKKYKKVLDRYSKNNEKYQKEFDNAYNEFYENSEIGRELESLEWDTPEEVTELKLSEAGKSALIHEIQHAIQDYEGFARGGNEKVAKDFKNENEELKDVSEDEIYKRLAGEVEARNVQARMNMSEEERKETAPYKTQDVDDEEALLVFKSGASMAYKEKTQTNQNVIDWTNKFDKVPTFAEIEQHIKEIIASGEAFDTLSPEWKIDIKGGDKVVEKIANDGNFQRLNMSARKRHNKYVSGVKELINNAVYDHEGKNIKPKEKPNVLKYHYFKVDIRIGEKVYHVNLECEETKNAPKDLHAKRGKSPSRGNKNISQTRNGVKTVHLYNIKELGSTKTYFQSAYHSDSLKNDKILADFIRPIQIDKNSVPNFENIKDLKTWIEENLDLLGNVEIKDTSRIVQFSKSNIGRSMKGIKRSPVKRNSYVKLKELVENSIKNPKDKNVDDRHNKRNNGQEIYHNAFEYEGNIYGIEISVDIPKNEKAPYAYAGHKVKIIDTAFNGTNLPEATVPNISINDIRQLFNPNIETYYQEYSPYEAIIKEAEQYAGRKMLEGKPKLEIKESELTKEQKRYRDTAYDIIWYALSHSKDEKIKHLFKDEKQIKMQDKKFITMRLNIMAKYMVLKLQ